MSYKILLGSLGLLAIALIVALAAATWSPSYQDCKAAGTNQTSNHKQNNADLLITRARYGDSTFIDCESYFASDNGNAITALATVFLGVITALLGAVAFIQLRTSQAQMRAQITPQNFAQLWEKDAVTGLYSWRFRPYWFNSGDTPTRNLELVVDCEVRNTVLPPNFDVLKATRNPPRFGMIGPKFGLYGGLAPLPPATPISAGDLRDAQQLKKFIYLYGWTRYRDIFPGTDEHVTTFCWFVLPMGDPLTFVPDDPNHPLKFDFLMHERGNDAT